MRGLWGGFQAELGPLRGPRAQTSTPEETSFMEPACLSLSLPLAYG